jgi:hypothetical protein
MSKRIKELASLSGFQAGIWAPHNSLVVDCESELEKFAELIIKECITQVYPDELKKIELREHKLLDFAINRVEKHFGIKE